MEHAPSDVTDTQPPIRGLRTCVQGEAVLLSKNSRERGTKYNSIHTTKQIPLPCMHEHTHKKKKRVPYCSARERASRGSSPSVADISPSSAASCSSVSLSSFHPAGRGMKSPHTAHRSNVFLLAHHGEKAHFMQRPLDQLEIIAWCRVDDGCWWTLLRTWLVSWYVDKAGAEVACRLSQQSHDRQSTPCQSVK